MTSIPTDKTLYNNIKREAKNKFNKWPSAYASGWLVKTYKERFKKKHKTRKNPYTTSKKRDNDLSRWYKEEWVNVCEKTSSGKYKSCGRKKSNSKKYPYCRPSKRINRNTPITVKELTTTQKEKMCRKKRKTSPYKKKKPTRVYVSSLKKHKKRSTRNYSKKRINASNLM